MHAQSSRMLDSVPHKWFTVLYERLPGICTRSIIRQSFAMHAQLYSIYVFLGLPSRQWYSPTYFRDHRSSDLISLFFFFFSLKFEPVQEVLIRVKFHDDSQRSFATRCVRWISFPLKYHLNLFHERFVHSKTFALSMEYYVISTFFGK